MGGVLEIAPGLTPVGLSTNSLTFRRFTVMLIVMVKHSRVWGVMTRN